MPSYLESCSEPAGPDVQLATAALEQEVVLEMVLEITLEMVLGMVLGMVLQLVVE